MGNMANPPQTFTSVAQDYPRSEEKYITLSRCSKISDDA
jgi:hypothetical protein